MIDTDRRRPPDPNADKLDTVIMQVKQLELQLMDARSTRIVTTETGLLARDINVTIHELWKHSQR